MKKQRRKYIPMLCIICAVCLIFFGCSHKATEAPLFQSQKPQEDAEGKARHVLLTHSRSEEHPIHSVALTIAETVEKETNGHFLFDIYPNNALGGEENNLTAVADGKIEMQICGNAGAMLDILSWLPSFHEISELGLSRSLQHGTPLYTLLCEEYDRNGVHLLCVFEPSFQVITCTKQPKTLKDFKGMRVRITSDGEPTEIAFWKSIQAEPAYYSLDTTYSAMQLGFINAAENPLGVNGSELLKSGKHFYNLKNRFQLNAIYISNELWNDLTEEERILFETAANNTAQEFYRQNPQIDGSTEKKEIEISVSDHLALQQLAGTAVRESLVQKYGSASVEQIEAILF